MCIRDRVKGVTYGNRQRAIEHLTRYASEDIHISLERDAGNSADRNATAVIAAVKGKGSVVMTVCIMALWWKLG